MELSGEERPPLGLDLREPQSAALLHDGQACQGDAAPFGRGKAGFSLGLRIGLRQS